MSDVYITVVVKIPNTTHDELLKHYNDALRDLGEEQLELHSMDAFHTLGALWGGDLPYDSYTVSGGKISETRIPDYAWGETDEV